MKHTFKTFAAVVIAALTIGLTGCSKDNEELIVGTWNAVSMTETISNHHDASHNGTHTEAVPEGVTEQFVFNKDNTGYIVEKEGSHQYQESFTYTVTDKTLTINIKQEGSSGTYGMTFNIDKLDKEDLILSMGGKEYDEFWDEERSDYVEFEYDYTRTIRFKKA